MPDINKEIIAILATETFKCLLSTDKVQLAQLNAAVSLLVKANIPFDLTFLSGTRRDVPAAELKIFINPSTTINFTFVFDG